MANMSRFTNPVREENPERARELAEWRAEMRREELMEIQLDCVHLPVNAVGRCGKCGKLMLSAPTPAPHEK